MFKIFGTIILCVAAIVFIIQNSDHVTVTLLVGSPVQIRLIFLLTIFFICGFVLAYLFGLRKETYLKKRIKELKNGHKPTGLQQSEEPGSYSEYLRFKEAGR